MMSGDQSGKNLSVKIKTDALNLFYGSHHALKDINMKIYDKKITAIIGPSGCGKSTLLRVFNRMNDLIPIARIEGNVELDGEPIYGKSVDVAALRTKVGMVFQKPNVFPMSIYENVIIGPKRHGVKNKARLAEIAEHSLKQAALWEEVKDELKKPGLGLPLGSQQRLCIARALAVGPDVILMDESCSALDPESTMAIEELMLELAKDHAILTVTHSMEQARRVSDYSAFMMIDDEKRGTLVEYKTTDLMFTKPDDKRTEDYITGRYG